MLWAALTVAFEAALVRGGGHPWGDVLAQYAIWRGSLWPLLVLWVLLAPRVLSALQRSGVAVGPTLGWAIVVWIACGLTFVVARALLGVGAALVIHLLVAPVIGAVAALFLWRHPGHPGVASTAATFAGTAAMLDAIVVAPFPEWSYVMFASPLGTWIPLALILAASATAAAVLVRGAGRRGPERAKAQQPPLAG